MKIGPFHLTYCTNVHPGESWDQIFANLKTYLLEVRDRLSPGKRFAAGIWLPERSINTLSEPGRLESFLEFLKSEDLYLSGVNAFPYGNFHAPPVKQSVYLPDWTNRRRLNYSNRVATVLSRILVDTGLQEGNLSTVPGAFKPSITETEQVETMARHFLDHAAHLHEIHQQTGRIVSLAIEPEPYCFLETTDEVIDFFQQHLMTPSGLQYFSDRTGVEKSDAEKLILRHVGVCFDVCHLAVQFEDPVESIETLQRSGIQIFRIQLSSAVDIEIKGELQDNLARLSKFNEEVYLHQVVERDLSEPEPAPRRFPDLPEALESLKNEGPDLRPRQWRIHFHLPLFLPGTADFGTTQSEVVRILQWLVKNGGCTNLEVETYTWDVLPSELQTGDRVSDIARELNWVGAQLEPEGDNRARSGWGAG